MLGSKNRKLSIGVFGLRMCDPGGPDRSECFEQEGGKSR